MKGLRETPHLFAKCVIWVCIGGVLVFGAYSLWGYFRTGLDPSKSLIAILGVLGGELALSCLRTVNKERSDKKRPVSESDTGKEET